MYCARFGNVLSSQEAKETKLVSTCGGKSLRGSKLGIKDAYKVSSQTAEGRAPSLASYATKV